MDCGVLVMAWQVKKASYTEKEEQE